jgi:hypothetical protein
MRRSLLDLDEDAIDHYEIDSETAPGPGGRHDRRADHRRVARELAISAPERERRRNP